MTDEQASWLLEFQDRLREGGLHERQVQKYSEGGEYHGDAMAYFDAVLSPGNAALNAKERWVMG